MYFCTGSWIILAAGIFLTMKSIEERKQALRKIVKERKASLSPEEIHKRSGIILNKVELLPFFEKSQIVLAYWALPGEVQTQDFILRWHHEKTILLPVIDGENLLLRPFEGIHRMQIQNSLGIAEPTGKNFTEWDLIDLAIIPGIAFDLQNNRLGRGKAYYDKLLVNLKTFRLGVCFSFQVFDQIPSSVHDIPMDMVLTD